MRRSKGGGEQRFYSLPGKLEWREVQSKAKQRTKTPHV